MSKFKAPVIFTVNASVTATLTSACFAIDPVALSVANVNALVPLTPSCCNVAVPLRFTVPGIETPAPAALVLILPFTLIVPVPLNAPVPETVIFWLMPNVVKRKANKTTVIPLNMFDK